MMKGVAPIKAQYLVASITKDSSEISENKVENVMPSDHQVPQEQVSGSKVEKRSHEEAAPAEDGDGNVNVKKRRRKGQNKQREKFSNQRAAPSERLCKAILCGTECSYGDACKFSHDVADFMSKKPADLSEECYNYKEHGHCPYGFACRYANSHVEISNDKHVNKVVDGVVSTSKIINSLSKENLTLLRKRKYDFSKSEIATKEAQKFVDQIVKRNVEINSTKKSELPNATSDATLIGSAGDGNVQSASTDVLPADETEVGLAETLGDGSSIGKPVGPLTNEDEFVIKPGEKKTIDFNNKLYLAPLTTVGNLPFRRICKTFGADITCGEMAVATKLLQGVASEWALVKRHSSEDVFGVQLCGAFANSMSRCTQLLTETCELDFIDVNVGCPIDLIFDQGAGSALMRRVNRFHEIVRSMVHVSTVPITVKIRTGISEIKSTAHTLIPKLKTWDIALTTLHGRSREQRYTKVADWPYIDECAQLAAPMPLYGGGDILSFEDYNAAMKTSVSGTMLARGALIKPWLFTEIKEQRHWDISSSDRLDILRNFSNYGLEHWGSDTQGVETTRRFMLEWLSFLHRYIPIGLLERVPQKINERPSPYVGRDDLETLMASPNSADWVKISEMLLGPVPDGFFFIPKHKANSYS